ncbi:uncharacterized protein [Euphorbia lathyris]|uniref:uncharacterized protein n=1 Tax=Euphorbia lathyris TaxID=212925 RepID=UPI0033132146
MDIWVVGAAAAAGYIAKYWQNVQKDRDSLSESGPSNHEKHELPSCPILRRFSGKKKKLTEDTNTSMVEKISNVYKLDNASEAEVCTSVYVGNPERSGNCNHSDIPSSFPLGFSTNGMIGENEDEIGLTSTVDDDSGWICSGKVDFFHDSAKKRRSLRTKYGHSIKPLSSLESCVMAQLYQEHSKMEEYMLSVFPSPSTTTRTLLVTDGNQIISRGSRDSFSIQINADDKLLKEGNVRGVLPLPKLSTLDALNKIKSKMRKGHNERLRSSYKAGNAKRFVSKHGSPDQTFLFCLGISVGIISSLLSSGRERDKLKDLLKQTENLVQDLQEELEMKDSLTVKELADENSESQDTSEERNALANYDGKESQCEKAVETSGDMSKIEAELEAELERLGLSINTSGQEGRLSDRVELDPDFVVDFAQGELRADMVNGVAVPQTESDRDASCTSTTPKGNYAVSPRELSLRLHEVIESRLEEHVKRLEQALQNSERKVRQMESQHKSVERKLSGSKLRLRYSSGEESPISEEDFNPMAQPLVMNLSGKALDAYNEAYEELMKTNESEEDDSPPPGVYRSNYQQNIDSFHPENGEGVEELVYDGTSEEEDGNDELEKQLIKQIVEQTRKGSPVVLNAQRMLFYMDEIEH